MARILLAAVALLLTAVPSWGCVGKTLTIGVLDQPRERMVAGVFSVFVAERTGTTVVVREYPDARALHQATLGGSIDLSLTTAGISWREVMGKGGEAALDELRSFFLSSLNLVWGAPVAATATGGKGEADRLTPVLRRDTLVKFPALPKLLRKLEGKIEDRWLEKVAPAGLPPQDERDRLSRGLLKDLKLI